MMVLIGIAMLCVTVIVGLYIRQRKPKETRSPNPTAPETTETLHSDTTPNNVHAPTSTRTRTDQSSRSAVGELVTSASPVVINASQTTPPFAQVVQEDPPEKPMIFGGLMDFKYQVRSVDPDELRTRPTAIPFTSTPAAVFSPENNEVTTGTSLDQVRDASIVIEGNDVNAAPLDQGRGDSRDIEEDRLIVTPLDEEGIHFSIEC